eukprot:NODE_2775_length_506_cov_23.437995_g2725_i0.p1 GENE.NODE_2775_length_506_cov_23.437995_g2725_i0~~NODE_2775_length_506_cov_23.437995_g2725_i0.p1  ORF type:complete len:111 (-),score=40.40 NODE_2775_length_506_cov_23.437995_g2725_i0:108-440(-)
MKYVAAYLLCNLAGKSGNKNEISKILEAAGTEVDDAKLTAFLKCVEGKSAAELIAMGQDKLASVPSGGGVVVSSGGGDDKKSEKKTEKKEEVQEEVQEEEEEDVDFDLFD